VKLTDQRNSLSLAILGQMRSSGSTYTRRPVLKLGHGRATTISLNSTTFHYWRLGSADSRKELTSPGPSPSRSQILALEAIGNMTDGLRLRVTLDGECRPPWNPGIVGDLPDPSFEIEVTGSILRSAAADLEGQLEKLGLS